MLEGAPDPSPGSEVQGLYALLDIAASIELATFLNPIQQSARSPTCLECR
jgi:hypothetical protein